MLSGREQPGSRAKKKVISTLQLVLSFTHLGVEGCSPANLGQSGDPSPHTSAP